MQEELIAQTRVYSPVNGVVTKRQVQTGAAVVQMRNELMTLVSSDTLYFEANAPESALPQLRPGMRAQVMLDAIPGKRFPGELRNIIRVAEGANRSVRLRVSVPATLQSRSVVGGFARGIIAGGAAEPVLSVPRAALVSDEGEPSVFEVSAGKAVRRPVVLDDPGGGVSDRVRIISGLSAGATIVTKGSADLTDGLSVKVVAH